MRVKQIEDLPMAASAELYQLNWVIEQLMADPRRIVQARLKHLHLHLHLRIKTGLHSARYRRRSDIPSLGIRTDAYPTYAATLDGRCPRSR